MNPLQRDRNRRATMAGLRQRAQRVRELADSLAGDEAEARLLQLADEYEEQAASMASCNAGAGGGQQ